jgi:hypothetical protein
LGYRDIEELFRERGLAVDHSTLNRWVLAYAPLIERRLRSFRKPHCESIRLKFAPKEFTVKQIYRALPGFHDARYRKLCLRLSLSRNLAHLVDHLRTTCTYHDHARTPRSPRPTSASCISAVSLSF